MARKPKTDETDPKTDEQTTNSGRSDSFHGELVNEDADHHGENGLPPVETVES